MDYAAYSVAGHLTAAERRLSASHSDAAARLRLRNAMLAWYGASGLSRDAFRGRFLGPYASDELVDHLRRAARGTVEARTPAALNAAGADLAAAVQGVGVERWPRFLAQADRRAVEAVSNGEVPGVTKVSATDAPVAGIVLGLIAGAFLLQRKLEDRPGTGSPIQSTPTIDAQHNEAEHDKPDAPEATSGGHPEGSPAAPADAEIPDDRREYILNGDGRGGGGHGPGRNEPGKSEFPQGWSDDRIIDTIRDVANDPASTRDRRVQGRTKVTGTRDGVDITVIIGKDGKTVVTAHPTNVPRNPQ